MARRQDPHDQFTGEFASDAVRESSTFSTATVLTGIVSLIALLFSGLSLYETVLKQAQIHIHVPDAIAYTRDPNGSYEVFAVPLTVANSGARDGIVSSLGLEVRNKDTGVVRQFAASFVASEGYFSTKEDFSKGQTRPKAAFAPLSVPGRSGFTGTILFYPPKYSEQRVVPGEGTYELTLTARMDTAQDLGTIDRLWSTDIAPTTFVARMGKVPRYFKGQMLSGHSERMLVEREAHKASQ